MADCFGGTMRPNAAFFPHPGYSVKGTAGIPERPRPVYLVFTKMRVCKKVVVTLSIFLSSLSQFYPQEMAWTALPTGEEKVGYLSYWETDHSRAIVYKGKTIRRPIMINVW